MNLPDEERRLLDACAGGDASAWETFVDRYSPFLYSSIRKVLAKQKGHFTPEEAESVYQDVFWEVFRDQGRVLRAFHGRSKLTTYLWVIAYRKTLEHIASRGAGRARMASLEDVPEPPSALRDPSSTLEASEIKAQVREGLARLPKRDRHVLSLFYYKSLSLREIAGELGIKAEAVGMIIFRGRRKLEKILKKPKKNPL